MKILVALSGGIDSSVVAHMLHEQGHELIGVMMKLWTDPLAPVVRRAIPTKCCSVEHIQRARSVCNTLGIPFYVLNIEEEFKTKVVDPFVEDYKAGETPNPCIECNRQIKFGVLLEKAAELGCDALATGHYARTAEDRASGQIVLLEGVDKEKDQSYYLYTLTQEKLQKVLFPLGSMKKEDVFTLAKKYDVPIPPTYTESQDLCFFPEREPAEFLKRYIPNIQPGDIKTPDGTVVGKHEGLPLYTIGQRRGLGIGGLKIPLHVSRKDMAKNELIVVPNGEDLSCDVDLAELHWISGNAADETSAMTARVHSLGNKERGSLHYAKNGSRFVFEKKIRGIAAGQSLVIYRGEEVVGGARIV